MAKKQNKTDGHILPQNPNSDPKKQDNHLLDNVLELPEDAVEVLKELPEDKQKIMLSAMISVEQSSSFAGPLPPPSLFKGYEQVLPGAADRILSMAEKEQASRHTSNTEMLNTYKGERKRGQYMGCSLVVLLALCGLFLGYLGHDWLSGVIFTGALISVPIIFVLNKEPKNDNKEPKNDKKE